MTNTTPAMPDDRILEYIQSLKKSDRLGSQVTACDFQPSRPGERCDFPEGLSTSVRRIFSQLGINKLYSHQLDAVNAVLRGEHAVISTPTASGKSLIYNLSFFEQFSKDPNSRAFYVFPLKALTWDQFKGFNDWTRLMDHSGPTAAIYDGDTSAYQRRKIRLNLPHVMMTNPEMLHLAFLPFHTNWRRFFSRLKLVVIDEVHTYRGLLGCHMAQVLRRLQRICRLYGARPTFVFASATIANPGFLTRQLTGFDVQAFEKNGAPQGGRHMVMMDPADRPAHTAILLLKAAMARKLRTIVYTQSRKLAELISLWAQQQSGRFADKVSVYRAGLLSDERRKIESDLKKGVLLAVVSTSALELGIDIGDLDLCILVGYPGSIMAARQRGGRVGRKGQSAAVILLAEQDGLDQYYISNPDAYFKGTPETAVINPYNDVVLSAHLVCAAAELPFALDESWITNKPVSKIVGQMEAKGTLLRSADGRFIHPLSKRFHHKVDLRAAGDRFQLFHGDTLIGEVNAFRLYRDTHVGAIYLHKGRTFIIQRVIETKKRVMLKPVLVDYHTRTRTLSNVKILEIYEWKYINNTRVCLGKVEVTDHVMKFLRIHTRTGRILDKTDLDVEPSIFITDSIWLEIGPGNCTDAIHQGYDLLGALHAAEHAVIGIMPLIILADRNDLGGLATPCHQQTESAAIFIYDGIPGGAGLSRQAYRQTNQFIDNAIDMIARCQCEQGCPACIHSPKCGSGNHPMDKDGARYLLNNIRKNNNLEKSKLKPIHLTTAQPKKTTPTPAFHFGVFDLETQRSAKEVGGWNMAHHMRVSCGVVYDSGTKTYDAYMEDQVDLLIDHLKRFDVVVGFNSHKFDYKVLSGYSDFDFATLPSIDLLELVHRQLGYRLSLDHLAKQTLNLKKSGSGLDALEWWKNGEIQKIIDYCKEDVRITLDLYLYLRDKGYLIYRHKGGEQFRLPIRIL
jgi:DEAD/DEAH box helicase domain-containing protein